MRYPAKLIAALMAAAALPAAAQQQSPPSMPALPPQWLLQQQQQQQSEPQPEPKQPAAFAAIGRLAGDQTDWARNITTMTMRVSMRMLVTNLMKKNIHEWRPDGSADNSMPSRHAIWAYGVAGTLATATGPYTPWVTVASHTLANGVGMQRVMARKHWPGDVFAGAGIGVGLDLIVRGVTNLAYRTHHPWQGWSRLHNDNTNALMSGTGAWLPSKDMIGRYEIGTGFSSWVRCHLGRGPVGVSADVTVMSAPLKDTGIAVTDDSPSANVLHPLNSITVSAGPALHLAIADGPVALRAEARCGYCAWLGNADVSLGSGSFTGAASLGVDIALTRRLQIGAEGGYDLSRLKIDGASRTVGAFTVALLTRACF